MVSWFTNVIKVMWGELSIAVEYYRYGLKDVFMMVSGVAPKSSTKVRSLRIVSTRTLPLL